MGISNTIPSSRLIQPGVVANTAARPTSPFTGQAIYQVDTNQMLLWNGTAWVIPNTPAQNPTGLELITTNSFTASTAFDITGFSSTYTNYQVQITTRRVDVVGMGTFNANLRNGASNIITGYYQAMNYASYLGTEGVAWTRNNSTNWIWGNSDSAAPTAIWSYDMYALSGGSLTFTGGGFSVGEAVAYAGGGTCNNAGAFDRVRIAFDYGTHTGSWSLYGYRK
jgi:hypothetical protein